MRERIGILGGTFDPPHVGHLLAAVDARERLALDRVVLVPAHQQPLKSGSGSSAAHRLAMCERLVEGVPGLSVDPIELDRGGLSFTVDTLRAFRSALPDAEFVLLLGEDAAAGLGQWREPAAIAALARIVVLTRHGASAAPAAGVTMERLATRRVDVSATEVRARVRAELPIRGFVPDRVAEYIVEHGLYGPTNG